MNREDFLDSVKQQYADDIREAYVQSEHGYAPHRVNVLELNSKLSQLMVSAKVEGLNHDEFEELARVTLPDVADQISLANSNGPAIKKAA